VTTAPDMPADENRCIRRWYTTWTTCDCPPCSRQRRHHRKLAEAGLAPRVTSDRAWEAIDRMLGNKWTAAAIATACGIPDRSAKSIVEEVRAGHRRRFGPELARRIVNHGEPTAGFVSATPSTRRLQALARLGHSGPTISEASSLWFSTLAHIRRGDYPLIRPRVASAIADGYRALALTPGTSERTRRAAERAGWPGVGAWDDIDDPDATPYGVGAVHRRTSDVALELQRDHGLTLPAIAARLGIREQSARRAIERARAREEGAA
jgi:hypothetical protein